MGKELQQTFFQRRPTNGQQIYIKSHLKSSSTSLNHQGYANKNHNELSPHACQMAIIKVPADPAISLLGTHPKETKTLMLKRYLYPYMFIAALFTLAKTWK